MRGDNWNALWLAGDRKKAFVAGGIVAAIEDGYISRNPMRKVKTPITRKPKREILEAAQARLFFTKITSAKHRALMGIASFCAMRTSEVFGLTWGAYLGDSILVKSTAWEG